MRGSGPPGAPPVDVAAGGQQDVPAGQLPQHAPTSRSWEVKALSVSPLRSAFRRARGWPGEITSGTYSFRRMRGTAHHEHGDTDDQADKPWAAPSGDPGAAAGG